jgi:S-adenosylmethionine:tRNA-ribosyltransferase-isomerase (queuine synthetase)
MERILRLTRSLRENLRIALLGLLVAAPVQAQTSHELPASAAHMLEYYRRCGRDPRIVEYLRPGDLLILNQTRVIPARLFGRKAETGGQVELLLLQRRGDQLWEALVRGKKIRPGTSIELQAPSGGEQDGSDVTAKPRPDLKAEIGHTLAAEIVGETESGGRLVRFEMRCFGDVERAEAWLDEIAPSQS